MKKLISLSSEQNARIGDLVRRGVYPGFQEFMDTAIENLLIAEEGSEPYVVPDYDVTRLRLKDEGMPLRFEFPPKAETLDILGHRKRLIWGPHRLFPAKYICRLLFLQQREHVELKRFRSQAAEDALRFGHFLSKIDEERKTPVRKRLSAGFPISAKQAQRNKAKDRFGLQYVFSGKRRGKKSGAVVEMLLANNGTTKERIGLTFLGNMFAMLPNPIIDEGVHDQRLSREETKFLLKHFKENIPAEYEAMEKTARWVDEGENSKVELNRAFEEWMGPWQKEWRDLTSYADTQRAGTINRMAEMGLVEKRYRGFRLDCSLTVLGRELMF